MKALGRALIVATLLMNVMGVHALAAQAPSSTSLTSSLNPALTSDPVTFTATVTSNGQPVTEGQVQFKIDGANQGFPAPLNASGKASMTKFGSSVGVGTHNVSADYLGTPSFSPSTASVSQVVNPAGPNIDISPATLPIGQVGQAYSVILTASGGVAPYTFSLSTTNPGTFPPGLTLATSGQISGTPTTQGNYNFSVVARDANGASSGDKLKNIKIDPAPAPTPAPSPTPAPILVPVAPPFSLTPSRTDLPTCTPTIMDNESFSLPSTQHWYVRAASASLAITLFARAVNVVEESGSVTATLYDGTTVLGTVAVSHPSGGGAANGDENSGLLTAAVTSGRVYRLQIDIGSATTTPREARHYRLRFTGADQAGFMSPGLENLEESSKFAAGWALNVAPGEDLAVRVFRGNITPAPTAEVWLIDPSGTVARHVTLVEPSPGAGIDGMLSVAAAAGGQWLLMVKAVEHYRIDKQSGPDRGVYATWHLGGTGSVSVSASAPVDLTFTKVGTGETVSYAAVTSAIAQLSPGTWDLSARATSGGSVTPATQRFTVWCDSQASVSLDVQQPNHSLTVSKTGTGSGTVTSTPAGIDCGATCAASFAAGAIVTLSASPSATSTFTGWSGACAGAGTCTLTMDAAKSVTATFTKQQYTLTVARTGSGSGTVTSSSGGIYCGASCSATFSAGDVVTLTATPDASSTFAGWSGACSGSATCSVTMTGDLSVSATFVRITYALTVSKSGTGSGTVTSSPPGIDCGASCASTFAAASLVTLTATPSSGSVFAGWSGACSGSGTCSVTMDAAKSVTATFTKQQYTLTVTRAGSGSGTVTSSPAGIYCGAACSAVFDSGTVIVLTATPDASSTFAGWSGACAGTSTCTLTMDASRSATATFIADPVPAISIADASTTEGNGGFFDVYVLAFTVSLSAPSSRTITVDFVTGDGTATTADSDYTATAGTVTFAPGETTKTITIDTLEDTKVEADETFTVTLSAAVNATIARDTATGTILNDDSYPTVYLDKIGPAEPEGSSGGYGATIIFPILLTAASSVDVTVQYTLTGGTAVEGRDYRGTSGTVTIPAGYTRHSFNVSMFGDLAYEADETFTLTLSSPTNAVLGNAVATGTILNDDDRPVISLTKGTAVTEGDSGPAGMTFTVTLTGLTELPAAVDYRGVDVDAALGTDYLLAAGTLVFAPGETLKTISAAAIGDLLDEDDETFEVRLLNAVEASIGTDVATGTVIDDDATPTVSVTTTATPYLNPEGDAGTTTTEFELVLDAASGREVAVTWTAYGVGATSPDDFIARSGIARFAPGDTRIRIPITIVGDRLFEGPEAIRLAIISATNATIGAPIGQALIEDDDAAPTLSIDKAVREDEGDSGTTTMLFRVTLSAAAGTDLEFEYATADGTASSASDYTAIPTTRATIPAGSASMLLRVFVNGDRTYERDEDFTLTIATRGYPLATLGNAIAVGTIVNDDAPTFTVSSATVDPEGDRDHRTYDDGNPATNNQRAVFTITLAEPWSRDIPVSIQTRSGTATADVDFVTSYFWTSIVAGATTLSVEVEVIGDTTRESNETFEITVTDTTGRLATATATIVDDDRLTITPATIGSGSGTVTCTTDAGTSCDGGLTFGMRATFTAAASQGSTFTGWSGSCTGTEPVCTITVTSADLQLSATFTREFTLTIRTAGTGGGTAFHWNGVAFSTAVTKPYGSIAPTWSGTFSGGSVIPLKAEPDAGSVVGGWSGDCTSSTAECTVTMDWDKTVTVTFTPYWILTSMWSGTGTGSVTVSPTPDPSVCGTSASCYVDGTTVTLTATASSGSAFDGWSGDCSGTTPTCTIVMNSDKGVAASFDKRYGVTIIATTDGIVSTIGGTVRLESGTGLRGGGSTLTPGSLTDCLLPDACTGSAGSSITLRAVPAVGHVFTGWSGMCTGSEPTCTFTVTEADISVSARFAREYKLTVVGQGAGGGTVFYWNGVAYSTAFIRSAGFGSDNIWSLGYAAGSSATIKAEAATGSGFVGWTGDCSGRTECTLTMNADKTVYAEFSETYVFGGFLSPVEAGRTYRLGSTVPIKFRLTDANARPVTTATARIFAYRVNGAVPETQPAESDLIPDDNDTFRFTDDHYQYNLGTKGFDEAGLYVVFVDLDDGTTYRTTVYLKR